MCSRRADREGSIWRLGARVAARRRFPPSRRGEEDRQLGLLRHTGSWRVSTRLPPPNGDGAIAAPRPLTTQHNRTRPRLEEAMVPFANRERHDAAEAIAKDVKHQSQHWEFSVCHAAGA